MAGYGLGVDIGTTWTAAAIARAGSEPQVVSLGGRTAAVPTVVHVLPDRSANVGDAAERRAATDPDRVSREFKRRLGDTAPVLLGGEPWSPETLLATVLRWVLARATELEGGAPDRIVVTHPANWGPLRRELFEQAITQVGVAVSLVTEPEAAAIHYASAARVPDGAVVAVYDLGGGTFDATVLRKHATGFEVLGRPEGVERLGGLDFDAAVLGHVTDLLGPAWTSLDPTEPTTAAAVLRLRHDCVLAKEALSEDADAVITVTLPTVSTEIRLTRGELEAMIRSAVEQSADALARAISAAGLLPDQVDRILLVGGSSRIPLVSQVLTARFGRPLALDTHPKHAVALGAARLALGPVGLAAAPVAPATAPSWTAAAPASTAPSTSPTNPVPLAAPAAPAAPTPPPAPPVAPAPLPVGGGGRKMPIWVPVLAVAVVLAIVAAFALGSGGGGGDDEVASGDDRTTTTTEATDDTEADGTTIPAVEIEQDAEPLVGDWFFEGAASQCVGLTDDDCAAFAASFTSNVTIQCNALVCEAFIATSDPEPIALADDGRFIAGGDLNGADGFQCDGAGDPTGWVLEITNVEADDEGTVTGFDATITLTSDEGSIDGNSCPFEVVVADGSASPIDGSGTGTPDGEEVGATVTLEWSSNADLDLVGFEPNGDEVNASATSTTSEIGVHSGDDNTACNGDDAGFEQITWPSGTTPGEYSVDVNAFEVDSEGCGSGDYTLTITVAGQEPVVFTGSLGNNDTDRQSFEVP